MKGAYLTAITFMLLFSTLAGASDYWVGFYGTTGYDELRAVSVMPNGDIVAVGKVSLNGTTAPWAIRLDRYGRVLWSRYYRIQGVEADLRALAVDNDGNIVAVGSVRRKVGETLTSDMLVMKLDGDGNVLWARDYDAGSLEVGNSVVIENNAIFVGGYATPESPELWVLRLNPYGDVVWGKLYLGVYPTFKPFLALDGSEVLALGILGSGSPVLMKLNPLSGGVTTAMEYLNLSLSSPVLAVGGNPSILNGNGTCLTVLLPSGEWKCYNPGFGGVDVVGAAYSSGGTLYTLSVAKPWPGINFYILGLSGGSVAVSRAYRLSDLDVPRGIDVSADSILVAGSSERFSSAVKTEGFVAKLPFNGAIGNYESKDVSPAVFTGSSEVRAIRVSSRTLLPKVSSLEVRARNVKPVGFLRVEVGINEPVRLYIDGNFRALLSGEGVLALSPGEHVVKLTANGYRDYEATVSIRDGMETLLKAELEKKIEHGTLIVNSSPSHAAVYLNGTLIGWTPMEMNLTPGAYVVEISKGGYRPYRETVRISPGEKKVLSVELEKIPVSSTSTTSVPTTTSATSTSRTTSSSTIPTGTREGTSSSTTKGKGGFCGPAAIVALSVSPLVLRRMFRREDR
ncbi:Amylopullulanase [Thermococcus sp. AM4]|nr:Amylopullulanase [Thermococcus sp. AM4]